MNVSIIVFNMDMFWLKTFFGIAEEPIAIPTNDRGHFWYV